MMAKMRSEPDGKRVGCYKTCMNHIIIAAHRMIQMVKMDLLQNHVSCIEQIAIFTIQNGEAVNPL